jgi:hypothetical protein
MTDTPDKHKIYILDNYSNFLLAKINLLFSSNEQMSYCTCLDATGKTKM